MLMLKKALSLRDSFALVPSSLEGGASMPWGATFLRS